MKHFFTHLLALLYSGFLYAQVPSDGLVAYYPFNGNANDESGNGRNGSVINGVTWISDRFGQADKACSFNGTDNYIKVPNWQTITGNTQRSISLWFKMPDPVTVRAMLFWGIDGVNQKSWLGYTNDTRRGIHYFGYDGNANNCWLLNRLEYFNDRWHHLVVTYNGTTMRLWFDGTMQLSTNNLPFDTGSTELFIGSHLGTDSFFKGLLDDIRIYNRGLSDTEVMQLYQSEAPPPSTDFAKIGLNQFIHTTGQYNTAVGNQSGSTISTGTNNTFTGYQTGRDNTSGSFNTFMGYRAGYQATIGSNNVFLGANTNPIGTNAIGLQNSVALGANAKVAISNAIILGDTTNTNLKVGIGTASPRYPLDIKGNVNIRRGSNSNGKLLFAGRASLHIDEQDYIVFTGGKARVSGLRFANLTSSVNPVTTSNHFLSLDAQGRVGLYLPELSANQVKLQVAEAGQWADHVFGANYPLMSIAQFGQYIDKHHHLHHLPSAQQMTDQGESVDELIKNLVRTQEEQALYILELQKQIDENVERLQKLLQEKKPDNHTRK